MRIFICSALAVLCFFYSLGQNQSKQRFSTATGIGDTIRYNGPTTFCEGGSLVLTANNAPNNATFQWQLNGANINGATSSNYTATTSGSYTVIVKDNSGNVVVYPPLSLTVNPYPVAGFSFSPNNQCSNTPVQFTNISMGNGATYTWSFGDNNSGVLNTSNAVNPSHEFIGTVGSGTQQFNVTLTADIGGCSNSKSATITTNQIPSTQLTGTGAYTYNGLPYFKKCASATSDLNFTNQSTTNNSNYSIVWGDGSSNFNSNSFSTNITHTYPVGNYPLNFIVTGQNGCKDTGNYYVFVGGNPAVGLGNPGNTIICSGTSLTFPISNTSSNPPGTTYTVTFNDGTSSINYNHPAPPDVTHTFNKGSCGTTSVGAVSYPNSFSATIVADNPCGNSAASVVPIYVSLKSKAAISISPKDTVCVTTAVTVSNSGASGNSVDALGVCSAGRSVWSITPSTGWTLTSGSLGVDYNSVDPADWAQGTNSIGLSFSTPGVYTIKLKTGGNTVCGADSTTKTICVNPVPVASFSVSANQGCAPFNVVANSASNSPNCGNNTYQWSVSYSNSAGCTPNSSGYSYANGTTASSQNPEFTFTNPGVYTITLTTKSPGGTCSSTAVSQTITVKTKPTAVINLTSSVCPNNSVTPTASVNNCYSSTAATYQWSFPGATPASSTSASPGSIVYAASGSYQVSLTVTNECGATTVNKTINVTAAPDIVVPQNQLYCAGTAVPGYTFTSSVTGTQYSWVNSNTAVGLPASGTGNIPAFTATNSSASPITATITVTPTAGCQGQPQSFTITVNPRPSAPTVVSPVGYCLNETASQLTATTAAGNTVTWYNNSSLTGGTTTAPTPNTSSSGTTTYYVTQTNSYNCTSVAASITVTVNPKISGNTIGSDQTICTSTSVSTLTPQATISGGNNSFSYQWQQSTDGGQTWTNITGATSASFSPGALSSSVQYRRVVNSGACSDTSNVVTITVQGTLSSIDISGPQTICSGSTPALLTGQTPSGGSGSFSYQWESSLNNSSWTVISGATSSDYQPQALTATTYFRRKTTSGPCSAYSSTVTISVNPIPVINSVSDKSFCNGSTTGSISFSSTPTSGVSYAWTNDNTQIGLGVSGNGAIPSFTAVNPSSPKDPLSTTISVTPTYTNNGVGCTGSPLTFNIIVLPTITINPISNETICTGSTVQAYTPSNDADNFAGSLVSYVWTVIGSGTTLTNGSGSSIPQYKGINSGTTDLTTTITVTPKYIYGSTSCDGTPVSYTVTVKPGTPPANAGPDAVLCAADTYTMSANQPSSVTGLWTQLGTTTATIVSSTSANTQITGLSAGNSYSFEWSLSGFSSCPSTKDTVVIKVVPDIVNTISTTTQITCSGQQVSVNGNDPTGGNGTYTYQWQQSTDNVSWTNITGATNASLTFTPTQSVYVKRIVSSPPCSKESEPAQIIVQPGLSNNSISKDQSICINTSAAQINGSVPTGGDGVYSYQWQQSTDGGLTWTTISGANLKDYGPGTIIVTTKYRRLVSTTLCSGAQASTSNVVTITVNPDAKAVFNPTTTVGCVPFSITPAIINVQSYPTQNSQYLWYVSNVLIGSGATFPGYTMAKDNDVITIKLVAISAFGCLNDSISHDFHTYETPQPSFTVSDTVGCGPLTVQINNTTPNVNAFTYQWNFGNGQTSSAVQPGQIILLPNPNHNDTTYQIKLSVSSSCNTFTATQSIRVKSAPKALFAPDKSVGCSPMTVTFNNTSEGIGNGYIWDFGDGSALVNTSSASSVSHTFYSGVQDTFYVRLIATNGCGNDTLKYAIVVSPNKVHLDFAINGNQFSGCSPHTVQFINNSSGATLFTWNFGDNNIINTIKNIDTVSHTYLSAGTYTVTLKATNGCSDTTSTETILVFAKPQASFNADQFTACIGDSIHFTNQSTGASSYLWDFGDGNTSTLLHPNHKYNSPGSYNVNLISYSFNAPTNVCTDTVSKSVQIVSSLPGSFSASDTVGYCAPFTVNFTSSITPFTSATWDFGDGTTSTGNSASHTYTIAGNYQVTLTVIVPGGCTYIAKRTIKLLGPSGSWSHTTGYLCNGAAAYFQVSSNNTDSLEYHFGDGTVLTTTNNAVTHVYTNGGTYLPTVLLKNKAACVVPLAGIDSIKVDKINSGFSLSTRQDCGSTTVNFKDTSHVFFGKANVQWLFGDGTTATGSNATHTYYATGSYPVKLIITGNSGCTDTLFKSVTITVYSKPVAAIQVDAVVCERYPVLFNSSAQSYDPINIVDWSLSNGVKSSGGSFTYAFTQAGTYSVQLIAGTVNGCYDTVLANIRVNPTPYVTASDDLNICKGNNASIAASGTGVTEWSWSPTIGLSCTDCTNTVATPLVTTPYVVEGKNSYGCSSRDTVVVTVVQPLQMTVSGSDSICVGQSTNLMASGASLYSWSPAIGLNNTSISNPTASPSTTTSYRVVGYDGFNCFTDTAFVVVAVGQYPTVSLGPDLTLAAGTLYPLKSSVQNGPIKNWLWSPATDLSCSNCALPTATIKRNISYAVTVTTPYGCSARDTVNIKVFCESAQAFIPNAFTPDGDGINDILMVRGKGIVMVKSFRIFNRWGELVFEKSDFPPNDPAYGWDGRIKGVVAGPDVYVYTAEVMCENGTLFTYKGNVSILK